MKYLFLLIFVPSIALSQVYNGDYVIARKLFKSDSIKSLNDSIYMKSPVSFKAGHNIELNTWDRDSMYAYISDSSVMTMPDTISVIATKYDLDTMTIPLSSGSSGAAQFSDEIGGLIDSEGLKSGSSFEWDGTELFIAPDEHSAFVIDFTDVSSGYCDLNINDGLGNETNLYFDHNEFYYRIDETKIFEIDTGGITLNRGQVFNYSYIEVDGNMRYNDTIKRYQYYNDVEWRQILTEDDEPFEYGTASESSGFYSITSNNVIKTDFYADIKGIDTTGIEYGTIVVIDPNAYATLYFNSSVSPPYRPIYTRTLTTQSMDGNTPIMLMYSEINNIWIEINNVTAVDNIIDPPKFFMSFSDSSETITISAANTPVQITGNGNELFTVGRNTGISSFVFQNDSVQLPITGWYHIEYDFSYSGNPSDIYKGHIRIDNIEIPNAGQTERGMSSSDAGVVHGMTEYYGTAGEWVKFTIENTQNTNDPTFKAGNVYIEYNG